MHPMTTNYTMINIIWFLSSIQVAQHLTYSTIIVFYLTNKLRLCFYRNPIPQGKLKETEESWLWLYPYCNVVYGKIGPNIICKCRVTRKEILMKRFLPQGWPRKFQLQLLSNFTFTSWWLFFIKKINIIQILRQNLTISAASW